MRLFLEFFWGSSSRCAGGLPVRGRKEALSRGAPAARGCSSVEQGGNEG